MHGFRVDVAFGVAALSVVAYVTLLSGPHTDTGVEKFRRCVLEFVDGHPEVLTPIPRYMRPFEFLVKFVSRNILQAQLDRESIAPSPVHRQSVPCCVAWVPRCQSVASSAKVVARLACQGCRQNPGVPHPQGAQHRTVDTGVART